MTTPSNDREAILALKSAQLRKGHSYNTRKAYRGWALRYRTARKAGRVRDLQEFLDHLATDLHLNPRTIKLALNALVFYHREVLGLEYDNLRTPRVNKNRNIPVFLTHAEVMALLSHMRGLPRLQAELLYGTGSRIRALLTLRLKDLDMQKGLVTFRHDKGGKSRTVNLPRFVRPQLEAHVASIRLQWQADHAAGIACPSPDPSLSRKLGRTQFSRLPWYWLFPSAEIRGQDRWHATDHGLSRSIARAADAVGIMKRVSPHVLRHSNAHALLDRGENIRRIQEHLGHTHVETTEIYTQSSGTQAVDSPLDLPPITTLPAKEVSRPWQDRCTPLAAFPQAG